MRKLFAIVLLLCPVLCFARKHAPLPDGVATAKTVYIVNQTGQQGVTDGAYEGFSKWGLSVAPKKESAALIATFTLDHRLVQGTSHAIVEMTVSLSDSSDAAYQTSTRVGFRSWSHAAKDCVSDFKKRVDEK